MKIVVSGIGETGFYLAKILLKDRHDLILIEKNEKAYRYAQERLDAQIIQGDCCDPLVMEPLIDEKTDLFVAVTDHDEANILSTLIARKYGANRAIARVSEPTNLIHPLLTEDSAVTVLNAEMAVAKDLTRLVGNPSADEIEFFANGKAEILRLHVNPEASIAHKKLKDIKIPKSWLFIAKIDNGNFSIVSGETEFKPGDQVLLMGSSQKSRDIETLLGVHPAKVRRVVIAGFNEISKSVAQALRRNNIEVRLVEEDQLAAEQAAGDLDGVLVIHGDPTSDDTLEQAGVDQTDYLLALTENDENNVLISLLAKEKKVKRVIALTQKKQYKAIIEKIGIDSVVNPRSAMVDDIMRSIHHKDISGIYILEEGKGQAMEFVIRGKSQAVGVPLARLKLPKQTLVGAIVRKDDVIIPHGNDSIEIGDRIVVLTAHTDFEEIKKLFTTGQ